jgi:hypothetical protein
MSSTNNLIIFQVTPPVKVRYSYKDFLYNGKQIIEGGITADGGEFCTINIGVPGTERPAAKL